MAKIEGTVEWESIIGKTIAAVEAVQESPWTDPEVMDQAKITFTDGTVVFLNPIHHWEGAGFVLADRKLD